MKNLKPQPETNQIAEAILELAEQVGHLASAVSSGYGESLSDKIGEHTYWMFKDKMDEERKERIKKGLM